MLFKNITKLGSNEFTICIFLLVKRLPFDAVIKLGNATNFPFVQLLLHCDCTYCTLWEYDSALPDNVDVVQTSPGKEDEDQQP